MSSGCGTPSWRTKPRSGLAGRAHGPRRSVSIWTAWPAPYHRFLSGSKHAALRFRARGGSCAYGSWNRTTSPQRSSRAFVRKIVRISNSCVTLAFCHRSRCRPPSSQPSPGPWKKTVMKIVIELSSTWAASSTIWKVGRGLFKRTFLNQSSRMRRLRGRSTSKPRSRRILLWLWLASGAARAAGQSWFSRILSAKPL